MAGVEGCTFIVTAHKFDVELWRVVEYQRPCTSRTAVDGFCGTHHPRRKALNRLAMPTREWQRQMGRRLTPMEALKVAQFVAVHPDVLSDVA